MDGHQQRSDEIPPLAGVCGLYCGACRAYIAGQEDNLDMLSFVAERLGRSVADTRCSGCRSTTKAAYCRTCGLARCALGRGLSFCNECTEFPCPDFSAFQKERPHRLELTRDLALIGKLGVKQWLRQAHARYSCPSCAGINSAYDLACHTCGHRPGSAFSAEHATAIEADIARRRPAPSPRQT